VIGTAGFPLGAYVVERDGPPLFVFELANNHQGSVEHGASVIAAMAAIARTRGVRAAVKLQLRDLSTLVHPAYLRVGAPAAPNRHVRRFLETRLSDEAVAHLVRLCRRHGLLPLATPFDERSVDVCEEHDLPAIKIASCSATDRPLLRRIAEAGKPVVCSTGGLTMPQIDGVVSFFRDRGLPIALMHCVSLYPAPLPSLRLWRIRQLRDRYPGLTIGYSGHERPDDVEVAALAVAAGATLLERHVGIPQPNAPLNAYSSAPIETERWVDRAVAAAAAMQGGDSDDWQAREEEALRELSRGMYAATDKRQGEALRPADVRLLLPSLSGQHLASLYDEVVDAPSTAGTDRLMPLGSVKPGDVPEEIRIESIAARCTALLEAAGCLSLPSVSAYLSHPHGLADFHRTGAMLNETGGHDGCEKIIVQLPGQRYPEHRHPARSEVYTVLWGRLRVAVDGRRHDLGVGDELTVPAGSAHSFESETGAVVREVATRRNADSDFADPTITRDPTLRRTSLPPREPPSARTW
jgi:sialic acid synthase SpsE/mannose-6-phosphate isomerase-like protein (cupin superfamily)